MTKQSELLQSLENLGLSEHESRVYFAMLSIGPATVLAISKASEVKRTTIYNVLTGLGEKGLVRVNVKGFKKLYAPEHPRRLESMLEVRKAGLRDLYPKLEAIHDLKAGESFVKYYQGAESIRAVHFDLLNELNHGEEFLVVGDPDRWEDSNETFGSDFIKQRNKIGLKIRMLLTNTETGQKYKKFERNFGEEIRLLPKHSKLVTNLIITPRKVYIQEMMSSTLLVVIENKSIVTMHTELFNVLWESQEGL